MKNLKLSDNIKVYCKSMGKVFRVRAIIDDDDAANEFMDKHPDTALIAIDNNGRKYIADKYQAYCKSSVLPD